MKKLHVTELTDNEFVAVFRAAARVAVDQAVVNELPVPSHSWKTSDKNALSVLSDPVKLVVKPRKKALA